MENNTNKYEVIKYYDKICLDVIDNMDSIKKFKKDYNERVDAVCRFKSNNGSLYKMIHPIKLIKNHSEEKRLNKIYAGFSNIYYESVVEFIKEETGDLKEDLNNAAMVEKPEYIKKYVKTIKLKK